MRIPIFTLAILSLALGLATSLPSAAQSQPANSPQAEPSQSTPAAPPSAQQNTPANNQGSAQSQTNEDNPLNLTEDQKARLRPIIMDENQKMEALRNDSTMTQDQKIEKAQQIRAEASPKIRAILTPEQLQKLAELQRERAQQEQNQAAPPSNSPQGTQNSPQPPPKQ
jgi:Spy/CpxP family protein refolding chaperone